MALACCINCAIFLHRFSPKKIERKEPSNTGSPRKWPLKWRWAGKFNKATTSTNCDNKGIACTNCG